MVLLIIRWIQQILINNTELTKGNLLSQQRKSQKIPQKGLCSLESSVITLYNSILHIEMLFKLEHPPIVAARSS